MIKLGLMGFGRTGSIVAKEIIKHAELSCVFRKSNERIGHDIGRLLGLENDINIKMSNINDMQTVLDKAKPDVVIDFSSKKASSIFFL